VQVNARRSRRTLFFESHRFPIALDLRAGIQLAANGRKSDEAGDQIISSFAFICVHSRPSSFGFSKNATKLPRDCDKITAKVTHTNRAFTREFSTGCALSVCNFAGILSHTHDVGKVCQN
jgi:hypothetical protein